MSVIDKHMYERLKKWCDGERPKNQFMMYVNSSDRALTDATIKKLMYEIEEKDIHGEEFVSLYSAKNFYDNVRKYYSHIAELYMQKPADDEPLEEIIKRFPSTCGWITLIIEDVDDISDDKEKTEEMFKSFISFAVKRSNIILIGNGDYKEVFEGCEFALREIDDGIKAKPEENVLMIGCYDQDELREKEIVSYQSEDKHRNELDYYWETLNEQLEKGYLDYNYFKSLFKDTLDYLIPRVTKDHVYRKDLWLIEKIGAMPGFKNKNIEGCKPWELDASIKYATALHNAIINTYNYNDDFSLGKIALNVTIEAPDEDHGSIHISGYLDTTMSVSVDTVNKKIDNLAEAIHIRTYGEGTGNIFKLVHELDEDDDNEHSTEQMEEANNAFASLMDSIKDVADRTVNKDPGELILRYNGSRDEEDDAFTPDGKENKIKIIERKYDIPVGKIKGYEKLDLGQLEGIGDCKLIRYIAVLDNSNYKIDETGTAMMTKASQKEYDDFVSKIRQEVKRYGIRIIDDGYGSGENELEWHITFMGKEAEDGCVGVVEIDTCVRTNDGENQ